MIEYLKYFFNPSHLFSLRPPAMNMRAILILSVTFVLLIIFGIFSQIMTKKTKDGLKIKGWRQFFHLCFTMGIIGLVYLFFAAEGVTLFSNRFLLIIWLVITLIWLGFIIKYMILDVPKNRAKI